MSNKGTKKCCICGRYDEPRYQVSDGFVCSDICLNQRETTNENRISLHRCEVCGKELKNCRIEDVYVSPDYYSGDDRDVVFFYAALIATHTTTICLSTKHLLMQGLTTLFRKEKQRNGHTYKLLPV